LQPRSAHERAFTEEKYDSSWTNSNERRCRYKRKEDLLELDGEIEVISAPFYSRAEHNVGRTF
jgi:hypothetical protein